MTQSHSTFGRDPSQWSSDAFTTGAVLGVGALTSALAAGIQSYRASRIEHYQNCTVQYLTGCVVISEHRIADALEGWQAALIENEQLKRDLRDTRIQLKLATRVAA